MINTPNLLNNYLILGGGWHVLNEVKGVADAKGLSATPLQGVPPNRERVTG